MCVTFFVDLTRDAWYGFLILLRVVDSWVS